VKMCIFSLSKCHFLLTLLALGMEFRDALSQHFAFLVFVGRAVLLDQRLFLVPDLLDDFLNDDVCQQAFVAPNKLVFETACPACPA